MGSFYTNFTVRSDDRERVAQSLRKMGCVAYFAAGGRDTVVYDRECDDQIVESIVNVGTTLSHDLDATALAILNHDDDILCYWLFRSGQLIDEYNSCPSYFDEDDFDESLTPSEFDAAQLCAQFGCPQSVDRVSEILKKSVLDEGGYVFASERHHALAKALGLPDCSVGFGYSYIENGQLPSGLSDGDLTRIG